MIRRIALRVLSRDTAEILAELDDTKQQLEDEREYSAALHEELRELRAGLERMRGGEPCAWPPLTAEERRELHMLRAQNKALHERLHALTMASLERDFTGAGVA